MIVKELEPFASDDPMLKAGRVAEEQIAFYLRRAFGPDPYLLVFNNLRLEQEGDAAQIDHLVLHRHGTIIIESKSVTGRVVINDHSEWIRWNGRAPRGMPSPILQAKRQARFFKCYLDPHAPQLRDKKLGFLQPYFGAMPVGVLVAISDGGIIERSRGCAVPEVCKADEVPDRVRALVKEHRRVNSLFNVNSDEGGYNLKPDELDRISSFLQLHHRPLRHVASRPGGPIASTTGDGPAAAALHPAALAPEDRGVETVGFPFAAIEAVVREAMGFAMGAAGAGTAGVCREPAAGWPEPRRDAAEAQRWSCRHCHDDRLQILHGQYGYYFKCVKCGGNTPAISVCPQCSTKERIRKSGRQFYRECSHCGTSAEFYTNAT